MTSIGTIGLVMSPGLGCGPFVEVAVLIMAETLSSRWIMGVGVKLMHVAVQVTSKPNAHGNGEAYIL